MSAPISVSVRDGWEEVESRHSMLADLLLMSEIKGYVHRPLYYFASGLIKEHRTGFGSFVVGAGMAALCMEIRVGGRTGLN